MRNTNKKGFTIVELVIVIAVIAILAAVLIPTFTGIIRRANQSADQQAVTNMNKLLAMNEKADDVDGVIEILIAEGYKGDLTTYYDGYSLAWLASENVIVLVEDNAIVFPEQYKGKTGFEAIAGTVANNGEALVGGLTDGKVVFVGENVSVEGLTPNATGDYEVKLNGNSINSSNVVGAWVTDTKLVISNGIIDGSAIAGDDVVVYASKGGSVELNNVQVYAPAGFNPIQCYGGTMVLNNVTTAQSGEGHATWYNSAIQVINTIKQEEGREKVWTIYGEQTNLTVNGGMYSGDKAIQISAPGGNVTIEDGTFIGTTAVIHADFAPGNYNDGRNYESVITINGGNFTGIMKVSEDTVVVINGGTFSFNPETGIASALNKDGSIKTISTYKNITINGTVVDNGNGTWTVQ